MVEEKTPEQIEALKIFKNEKYISLKYLLCYDTASIAKQHSKSVGKRLDSLDTAEYDFLFNNNSQV